MNTRLRLNKFLTTLENEEKALAELEKKIELEETKKQTAEKVHEIMLKAAALSQEYLAKHLSDIITQAIQTVVCKPYEFVCEFVERRGATEADLYLMKDGYRYEILESTGGGLADVCSFAAKVAYLLLSNNDRVLIIDEVSRHINSSIQRENFAKTLARLSKELEIQMIINTTIPELHEVADRIFDLSYVNEETKVQVRGQQ